MYELFLCDSLVVAGSGLLRILKHLLAIILPIAVAVYIFGHGDRTRVQRLEGADRSNRFTVMR